jgi:peptide-methionine (S)-S-oxide reductase
VFYHSDRQRLLAEKYLKRIDEACVFSKPVVTEITAFTAFYRAGLEHQDYYNRNSQQPYCRATIGRKLDKLRAVFQDRLAEPTSR